MTVCSRLVGKASPNPFEHTINCVAARSPNTFIEARFLSEFPYHDYQYRESFRCSACV